MATAVSVVPEKYRGTRFRADCWYHLANNYRKKGTWLTYLEYQKVGDKTCKENVFKQVCDEMKMDVLFKHAEAVQGPPDNEPEQKPTSHPPQPAKPPNLALANALAAGLTQSAKERSKGPVTVMRRQEAEAWIKSHLDSGYAPFKLEFQEPELDNAWWTKIRNAFLHPPEQENSVALSFDDIKFDPRTGPDVRKIVRYLITLSPDKINGTTASVYTEKTRHKIENHQFGSARRIVNGLLEGKGKIAIRNAAAAPAAKPAAPPAVREAKVLRKGAAPAGTVFQTLAEIDLAAYGSCKQSDLKAFALELVKTLHPRGDEAQVRILAEPPGMEIRVPV